MKLHFEVETGAAVRPLTVDIHTFVVAGWAGRDLAAIEHHIEELAALGVPRPSAVPLYYRVAENQLTQAPRIQALGPESSGEVEVLVFVAEREMYVGLTSDHTDRKLESQSVALAKQVCAKPVGPRAWRYADVADHWDELQIRSYISENEAQIVYQDGTLAALRTPPELIAGYLGGATVLPPGVAMSCGTVGAIGGIRPAASFTMELIDPRLRRKLCHHYAIDILPEVA